MKHLLYKTCTKTGLIAIFIMFCHTIHADGLIIIPRPYPLPHHDPAPFPLEVVYHRVNVNIENQIATTSIDQAFYNPTPHRLEGYYLFPIPKGAVMKEFTMAVNGKMTPAELLDAKKARQYYEEIVRKMRDPALLEYSDRGLFKVRIFPIEPRSEKKVSISYHQILEKDNQTVEYLYPLNTEKFSAKPLKEVSIKVELKSEESLKNIFCPTHEIDVVRKSNHTAIVSYEQQNVKPDIDFKLYFDASPSKIGLSLLSYHKEDDGFFLLSASPAMEFKESEINEKDITFVLDVSGSMAGEKLKQAKQALTYCVENLNPGDRFEIIRFSTEAEALFNALVPANDRNRKKAGEFIQHLRSVGGTHIEEALQLALSTKADQNRPHMIIFITDGKPTIGETDENKLIQKIEKTNSGKTRIFTFGIGHDINTHLLDKMTELTKATRSYISPSEDIEIKISNFYDKVRSPILTDLSLTFEDVEIHQIYPKNLPDLFHGANLIVLGRYKGSGENEVTLSGILKGKKKIYHFRPEFVHENETYDFIPMLWASRRIGHLLDLIRLHGEDKELVDEVTELARTYGIVTPYTSYLIMEDESNRVARREIRDNLQTLSGSITTSSEAGVRLREEFESMALKSGEESVRVSKELNGLNDALNMPQMAQGRHRLDYIDMEGNTQNLAQQVRNIQGRAVYQTGAFWVDSQLQNVKPRNTVRIQFASVDYFDLYRNHPSAAQFLALGSNVRFYYNNTFYEIYE